MSEKDIAHSVYEALGMGERGFDWGEFVDYMGAKVPGSYLDLYVRDGMAYIFDDGSVLFRSRSNATPWTRDKWQSYAAARILASRLR